METFKFLELDLQKEFSSGIEGSIVAVVKDPRSSATLLLEKIVDGQQNKSKYVLHIKLWAVKDLLSSQEASKQNKLRNKLSLPLGFVHSQGFVNLDNHNYSGEVSMSLNSSSSLIMINLGFNVFCKCLVCRGEIWNLF